MSSASIEEATEFVLDGTHGSPVRAEIGIPVLSAQNVKDGALDYGTDRYTTLGEYEAFKKRLALEHGDVLLTIVGTIGRAAVLEDVRPLVFQRSVAVIRPRKDMLCPRFLYHVSQSEPFQAQLARASNQSSQAGVYLGKLKKLRIPLPPLPEQRRIAEILDKADALRAKRRAALAQLDTLTQSIFLDMFGDPATNPKGWPTKRLDAVCSLVNGRAFKPEEWEEEGLPIIRIQNLNDAAKPFNYTTQSWPERFRVRPDDILFSWSGTPGTSFGCFRWSGPEGWLNQHIFNVRLNGTLEGDYFIAHVNSKLAELIAKAHGGVGLQHVTKGMVDETLLMIPPAHRQVEFSRRVAGVEALATDQRASLRDLDSLFGSLQYRAFRGELVRDEISPVSA
jgi:type I restriction enzyme S subunit